mmetsp:Transcript_31695/g.67161  ORF Transcript_31695/g.67161 Transcript_31695/m.67161 type:complete len:152 (+) Transcript_31695:5375-5830(+)
MEAKEDESVEADAVDDLFVGEEEADFDPGEGPVDGEGRRDEFGEAVAAGADQEGGGFLVVVEAAEEDEEDDDHDGVHHGQGGEGHGVGVVGGHVFDVRGEEAQTAVGGVAVVFWGGGRNFCGAEEEFYDGFYQLQEGPFAKFVEVEHPLGY